MTERFEPAWWLRNPHAQTIWSKFARRTPLARSRRERWELDDGDFLELQRHDAPAPSPRLLLLHGLEGSPRSHYVRGFFAERRIKTHFVDLTVRAAALGELRRFAQKFGVHALLDPQSRRYQDLGLRHSQRSDERWLELLADEPAILRVPLVRCQQRLTIGLAEEEWARWIADA